MNFTFKHGPDIWFNVTVENGKITDLQEHDPREGGSVTLADDPWFQFIEITTQRGVPIGTIKKWMWELKNSVVPVPPKMVHIPTSNRTNFILDTDSYKLSHFQGYPKNVTNIYSYAESRGGRYDATVVAGIQKFVMDLATVRITMDDLYEAQEFAHTHGEPFNGAGWERILKVHGGRIPVIIKAVAEGSVVPTRNVLVTVENTDPTMPWLTSYIETQLLRALWYPTTVATRVHEMKKRIKPYFDHTSDTGNMDFALLDFGLRGATSREAAEVAGMAHLMSFSGSDNIPAVLAARRYYAESMAAYSVPATEHSVMTSFGKDNELDSFKYLIENMMPENGILSVVSDTWDVFEACHKWVHLADKIRAKNGTLVVRPDSGEMWDVLPEVLSTLSEGFGYDLNSKGFKVLRNVKVLQGDGINEETVVQPFEIAQMFGISADSIMTGSGGGIQQVDIDRDTCKFAFKACNVTFEDGTEQGIAKDPITDPGKRSKMGRLELHKIQGMFTTITQDMCRDIRNKDQLRTIYKDGELLNVEDFATIRKRLALHLV